MQITITEVVIMQIRIAMAILLIITLKMVITMILMIVKIITIIYIVDNIIVRLTLYRAYWQRQKNSETRTRVRGRKGRRGTVDAWYTTILQNVGHVILCPESCGHLSRLDWCPSQLMGTPPPSPLTVDGYSSLPLHPIDGHCPPPFS